MRRYLAIVAMALLVFVLTSCTNTPKDSGKPLPEISINLGNVYETEVLNTIEVAPLFERLPDLNYGEIDSFQHDIVITFDDYDSMLNADTKRHEEVEIQGYLFVGDFELVKAERNDDDGFVAYYEGIMYNQEIKDN